MMILLKVIVIYGTCHDLIYGSLNKTGGYDKMERIIMFHIELLSIDIHTVIKTLNCGLLCKTIIIVQTSSC